MVAYSTPNGCNWAEFDLETTFRPLVFSFADRWSSLPKKTKAAPDRVAAFGARRDLNEVT
jgi:hypothetical protein